MQIDIRCTAKQHSIEEVTGRKIQNIMSFIIVLTFAGTYLNTVMHVPSFVRVYQHHNQWFLPD